MALGGIDLNLLMALRALLEEGNVTHAGARIGMSQPTMSAALARLRRHYKDELLVRVGRDHELTPLAKALLPQVQETLRHAGQALALGDGFDPCSSDRAFSFMLSDYATTVLQTPLLSLVHERAPNVRIDLSPLLPDLALRTDTHLLRYDIVVVPRGYGLTGRSRVIFTDRYVCVVDSRNKRLRDGRLSLADLAELPHAVVDFGPTNPTAADRILGELDVQRRVQVSVNGFLPLPFVVAGTDLVAVVPERLARRAASSAGVVVVEPPFGRVELVEAVWWHPTRSADPAHRWLLGVLDDVAATLSLENPERGRPAVDGQQDDSARLPRHRLARL